MAQQKSGAKQYTSKAAMDLAKKDVPKPDGSDQTTTLSFGFNPSSVTALSALSTNPRATLLFDACSEAFKWGSSTPTSLDENPPSIQQGTWDSVETELIRQSALSGRFTKNTSASGQLTAEQQESYANTYGLALAQGLSDALGKKPENKAYSSGTSWPDGLEANFQAIYTAAYWVYGSYEFSGAVENGGTSDQETASNLGRNLLIGVLLAGAAAAGLYWYSTTQKKAKANPSDMKLYQINDEEESITLDEFLSDNRELDPEDVEKIKSLGVEETFHSGGGAQPEWKIRRVY